MSLAPESPRLVKVLCAVFYGLSSILIVFVNKILLTNLRFPAFMILGLFQMLVSVSLLYLAKICGLVSFPRFDWSIPRRSFPLPLLYALSLVTGLGGTQRISLPMFTVLRRFSILLTMIFEFLLLREVPSFGVKISVFLMIFGAIVAALFDLSFDAYGYTLIFINDLATAANGVYTKKLLGSKDLGKYGLLYYNSLFMIIPLSVLVMFSNEVEEVREYIDFGSLTVPVIVCFVASCFCAFILNYSMVLCTSHNSALTTVCIGPIKNIIVTYAGMVISGDYIFQWTNFLGVFISVIGSILYTYVTFRTKSIHPTSSASGGGSKSRFITVEPSEIDLANEPNERLIP